MSSSMEENSAPAPLPVVLAHEDHTFSLDEEALSSLLLRKDIAGKKVVVVSVAGAFRKGKSFYWISCCDIYEQGTSSPHSETDGSTGSLDLENGKWLGDEGKALTGFHWRGGSERDTTGILVWNEPFFRKLPTGEEVAVLVMDTQGAFDTQSTVKDCATVFALSTMISSVQVYNLAANIQEDDLQHLQLFTEYGRLAMENTAAKPFQELMFLVRDWSFPYEAEYGLQGGAKLLARRLQISDKQHPELQQLRRHIQSCFDSIQCFLMPHPGLKVATNPKFDGRLSDIESEFKQCLIEFMPLILSPEKLVPKEINGQKITARELLEYFKSYIKIYQSDTLPEPKTMLEATAEANNLSAVNEARELYMERMEAICGGDMPYLHPQTLEHEHTVIQGAAVGRFKEVPKMGGDEFSARYLQKLQDELENAFGSYSRHNQSKNFFNSFRTPATLFVVIVAFYVVSGFLEMIGMRSYANFFALSMGGVILAVVTWGACRLTGSAREIGQVIDETASWIWENIVSPMTQQAGQRVANAYPQYKHMADMGNISVRAGRAMNGGESIKRTTITKHNAKKLKVDGLLQSNVCAAADHENNSKEPEIYTVIADAKIRELRESMATVSESSRGSNVLHFSDGTLCLDELEDDDDDVEEESGPVIDPRTLPWAPWMWYQALTVGGKAIQVCDYLGEHLADFFGITTPKYQLEIDEHFARLEEDKHEQLQAEEDRQQWSSRVGNEQIELGPRLSANDLVENMSSLSVVSEQPAPELSRQSASNMGQGDAPLVPLDGQKDI